MSDPTKYGGSGAGTAGRGKAPSDPFEQRLRERKRLATTWADAMPEHLARAVEKVTATGDALMFGTTSDGGALTAIILRNGRKFPWYIGPGESIIDALEQIADMYE